MPLPSSTLHHPAPRTRLPAQVDCVNSALGYGSAGCNGGYSSDVLSYVAGFRATTETDYGWVQGRCGSSSSGCRVRFMHAPGSGDLPCSCPAAEASMHACRPD